METAFTIFIFLVLAQSFVSLFAVIRLTRYVWRSLSQASERYIPKTALIVPCKELEPDFDENIIAYLAQDYRHYELIFVTESEADPAYQAIRRILQDSSRSAWLVTAGEAQNRGQKVHNLCAALDMLDSVDRKTEVLVFADSDARPDAYWLRDLVAPLSDPKVGATTGFRWYLPQGGLASHLLSVWNSGALSLLGENSSFAWGGSTAINRDTFEALKIKQHWESGAVSDDYILTKRVQAEGLKIKFVPQCLMASEGRISFRQLLEFTTRQMIITRVYAPQVWTVAAVVHTLFNFSFWGGLLFCALGKDSLGILLPMLMMTGGLGALTGMLRAYLASRLLPEEYQDQFKSTRWASALLGPVVSLIYLYNLVASLRTRKIMWRGIGYEMITTKDTVIWQRPEPVYINGMPEKQATPSSATAHLRSLDS